jgi:hypothetical protein
MLDRIPRQFTIGLASKLTGLSPRAFKDAYVSSGRVEYSPDGLIRPLISRRSLDRALGRTLTLAEVQAASSAIEPRRAYQREYRRRSAA